MLRRLRYASSLRCLLSRLRRLGPALLVAALVALAGAAWPGGSQRAFAQQEQQQEPGGGALEVSGVVRDSSGATLPGVSVLVKGTQVGAATGTEGRYALTAPSPQDTLVFSFIGFDAREVPIQGRSEVDVTLGRSVVEASEVVVVGYGTQKKENLTGSVAEISGERLDDRVIASPVEGLQGLVPGLNVSVGSAGGAPGATADFNIRGTGSINGGDPLVLVDGVEQSLDTVNPQDIESISVLKGSAASAIYGADAPFGVVLVETKMGSQEGEMRVSYTGNVGWKSPTRLPDMANSVEWAETFNQAARNAGKGPVFGEDQMARIRQYLEDPESIPATIPQEANPDRWGQYGLGNANTDWFDVYYKPWAMNQTHNLSVSGGAESVTYYLSGGLFDRGGQFRYGDDSFQRYNATAKIQADLTDWLDVSVNAKYTNRHTNMPYSYSGIGSYYHDIPRKWPNVPARDPNGHFLPNGIAMNARGGRDIDDENQFLGKAAFTASPLQGWDINTDISYRLNVNSGSAHKKEVQGYTVGEERYSYGHSIPTAYSSYNNQNLYRSTNVYTSYERAPGKHFLRGLVGFQEEEYNYDNISGNRRELVTDEVPSISTATGESNVDDDLGQWGSRGVFVRLNYNYDERYLLEFNARYDGSSRFPEGDRWGFFPSVSAGYNIAQEPFWEDWRGVANLLKVRASYGSLGNHDIRNQYGSVQNYPYVQTIGVGTNLGWLMGEERPTYVTAPGLIAENLTWETVSTLNLGLDAELLEGRLSLTADWYQRNTSDMFGPTRTFPAVLGTSAPRTNNADLSTTGFEVTLGWNDAVGEVQYNVQAQLSDHTSEITKYRNDSGYIYDYYVGQQLGEIWGYTTEGLYASGEAAGSDPTDQSYLYPEWGAGDVNYQDLDGDGEINVGDQTLEDAGDLSIIGNSTPRYQYSLDLGVKWNGISVSTLWQGVGKRDLWLGGNFFWGISGGQWQSSVFEPHLDYWREGNEDAYYPKPYLDWSENAKNKQTQTKYLQNGAYLRLKNLQVAYTLPGAWTQPLGVRNVRVYFSGENLLTVSPIMEAFDPEAVGGGWGNGKLYPLARTLSVGVNLGL